MTRYGPHALPPRRIYHPWRNFDLIRTPEDCPQFVRPEGTPTPTVPTPISDARRRRSPSADPPTYNRTPDDPFYRPDYDFESAVIIQLGDLSPNMLNQMRNLSPLDIRNMSSHNPIVQSVLVASARAKARAADHIVRTYIPGSRQVVAAANLESDFESTTVVGTEDLDSISDATEV